MISCQGGTACPKKLMIVISAIQPSFLYFGRDIKNLIEIQINKVTTISHYMIRTIQTHVIGIIFNDSYLFRLHGKEKMTKKHRKYVWCDE